MRLFDTMFLIDLLNDKPSAVGKAQQADQEKSLNGISVITVHEYLFGVHRLFKRDLQEKLEQAYVELAHFQIFPVDYATVKISSQLHADLAARGSLIGLNDIYIAATAIQHGLTLTTKDQHFARIPNLQTDFY